MSWLHMLLGLGVFVPVLVGSYLLLQRWIPDARDERLRQLMPDSQAQGRWQMHTLLDSLTALLQRLSHWAAPAADRADQPAPAPSGHRQWLVHAGFRGATAEPVFLGLKTAWTLLLAVVSAWIGWMLWPQARVAQRMAWLLAACTVGYYLPDMVLRWLVTRRQTHLFHAFPDALDLLRICVQAGLGLDAAIERVGRDMRLSSRALAEEFTLTSLELRAGMARAAALRHLSERIGLQDLEALVSMLIQADRFGSSMSESLVVYSQSLRTRRRLLAEEAAAKLPVKLLIPLIFCIFPSLLMVLLGPVLISFQQHFHPQAVGA